jgi:hypothetical protein
MNETEDQIIELQAIIDRSFDRVGPQAAAIMSAERRLSARQVIKYLEGMKHIVVGTVTSKGEPRVAPVDGHFLRGRFWFGTGSGAFRIQHLRRNRALSAFHLAGDELGIVVHGRATLFATGGPEAEEMRANYTKYYGSDPYTWPGAGEVAWVRIDPTIMTTFAMDPSKYPE